MGLLFLVEGEKETQRHSGRVKVRRKHRKAEKVTPHSRTVIY